MRPTLNVGGEDYETWQESDDVDRLDRLERWTRARFPMAGELTHRWFGQVIEPDDYLAFIGSNPDGKTSTSHGRLRPGHDARRARLAAGFPAVAPADTLFP